MNYGPLVVISMWLLMYVNILWTFYQAAMQYMNYYDYKAAGNQESHGTFASVSLCLLFTSLAPSLNCDRYN